MAPTDLEGLAILNKLAAQAQADMQKAAQLEGQRSSKMHASASRQKLLIDAVKAAETGRVPE